MGRRKGLSFGRRGRGRSARIFTQRAPVKQEGKWTWNRITLYILSSLGVLGVICSPLAGSTTIVELMLILVPLCLYIFFLTACRDLVVKNPYACGRRRDLNMVPCYPFLIFLIILFLQFRLSFSINIMDGQRAFFIGIVIFIILYAFYWYFALKSDWTIGSSILVAFVLIIYSYSASIHLNYIMVNKPTVHVVADVMEVKRENAYRGGYNYYIYVKNEAGESEHYQVSKGMYEYAGRGSTVLVCQRNSVFGVRSRVLHESYSLENPAISI